MSKIGIVTIYHCLLTTLHGAIYITYLTIVLLIICFMNDALGSGLG
jgi:hypothetical protein